MTPPGSSRPAAEDRQLFGHAADTLTDMGGRFPALRPGGLSAVLVKVDAHLPDHTFLRQYHGRKREKTALKRKIKGTTKSRRSMRRYNAHGTKTGRC